MIRFTETSSSIAGYLAIDSLRSSRQVKIATGHKPQLPADKRANDWLSGKMYNFGRGCHDELLAARGGYSSLLVISSAAPACGIRRFPLSDFFINILAVSYGL